MDHGGQEATDFVAGQRDQTGGGWVPGAFDGGDRGEQGVGEHGQHGRAPPGQPTTDLVFVEPGQALTGLE